MPNATIETTQTQQTLQCDRDCSAAAVLAYQWEWGERGVCCATHAALLQQIAPQIARTVTLIPLARPMPEPLLRDERVRLTAEALVLREELEEHKVRGLEMYRINGEQQRQINTLKVRDREAAAQLKDAEQQQTYLRAKLEERDAEHAELVTEIDRLRHLEALLATPGRPGVEEPGTQPGVGDFGPGGGGLTAGALPSS